MIALKNILVATDFGNTAASALAYGRELARQYQGRLHVFHAVDDLHWRYSLDMSPGLLVEIQDDLEESARQRMTGLLTDEDRAQRHAIGVVSAVCPDPAASIVEYARSAGVDVIIIGTHGRRGVSRLLLGSVAEQRRADGAVPGPDDPPARTRVLHHAGRTRVRPPGCDRAHDAPREFRLLTIYRRRAWCFAMDRWPRSALRGPLIVTPSGSSSTRCHLTIGSAAFLTAAEPSDAMIDRCCGGARAECWLDDRRVAARCRHG